MHRISISISLKRLKCKCLFDAFSHLLEVAGWEGGAEYEYLIDIHLEIELAPLFLFSALSFSLVILCDFLVLYLFLIWENGRKNYINTL